MKATEKKIYHVSTSGDTMVTEDGLFYSTNIRLEKRDFIIDWDFDEPFDLNKATFEDIVTTEDLYATIENMTTICNYPKDYFADTLKITDMNDVMSLTVTVDMEVHPCPDGCEIIDEFFDVGCVGYDFINKKPIFGKEDIDDMIYELTEYAENSGFKDYYNKAIKGKTEEEIKKLYREVFGK